MLCQQKKENVNINIIIGIHFQHTNFFGDPHEQIRRCSSLDIARRGHKTKLVLWIAYTN